MCVNDKLERAGEGPSIPLCPKMVGLWRENTIIEPALVEPSWKMRICAGLGNLRLKEGVRDSGR